MATSRIALVKLCKEYLADGSHTQAAIAKAIGIDPSTVSRINTGLTYPEVEWPNGKVGSFKDAYPEGAHRERVQEQGFMLRSMAKRAAEELFKFILSETERHIEEWERMEIEELEATPDDWKEDEEAEPRCNERFIDKFLGDRHVCELAPGHEGDHWSSKARTRL